MVYYTFYAAALAAEWFFIAGLSAAMKKYVLFCVLCVSSEAGGERGPSVFRES